MKFSTNLGFLRQELALPKAIHAAKNAGFDAVECHWPYDFSATDVNAALKESGLTMLGLNTRSGNRQTGENGLSALSDRIDAARQAIDEAIDYAVSTGTRSVHVMAGVASGAEAHKIFCDNLRYACSEAAKHDITILIEPLNRYDAPGYFLDSVDKAVGVVRKLDVPNLKLMFDCYHIQIMSGNLTRQLTELLPIIGHVQFASVPDRSSPDSGEIDYSHIFAKLEDLGWQHPLGAEYKPQGPTDETLSWLQKMNEHLKT